MQHINLITYDQNPHSEATYSSFFYWRWNADRQILSRRKQCITKPRCENVYNNKTMQGVLSRAAVDMAIVSIKLSFADGVHAAIQNEFPREKFSKFHIAFNWQWFKMTDVQLLSKRATSGFTNEMRWNVEQNQWWQKTVRVPWDNRQMITSLLNILLEGESPFQTSEG